MLSPTKIPIKAIGGNAWDQKLLRFALAKSARAKFLSSLPGSSLGSRISMGLIPAYRCGAHFLISCNPKFGSVARDMTVQAGQSIQRFWLAATQLGLVLQPTYATLAMTFYGRTDQLFTTHKAAARSARKMADSFDALCEPLGLRAEQVVFNGRIGYPTSPDSCARSVRLPLPDLMVHSASQLPPTWQTQLQLEPRTALTP